MVSGRAAAEMTAQLASKPSITSHLQSSVVRSSVIIAAHQTAQPLAGVAAGEAGVDAAADGHLLQTPAVAVAPLLLLNT